MSSPTPSRLSTRLKAMKTVTADSLQEPGGRRLALIWYYLFDYGFLRMWWTNMAQVAPGVWRSNQPGPGRMADYARMGIRSILMLRGGGARAHYHLERQAAEELGIAFHHVTLQAHKAAPKVAFLRLIDTFKDIEGPWLMHCKSGADRAGLASALYLIWRGVPVSEARKQLSFRFWHLSMVDTGILDVMLDQFENAQRDAPVDIETWLRTAYDPAGLTAEFKQGRRHGKPWPRH